MKILKKIFIIITMVICLFTSLPQISFSTNNTTSNNTTDDSGSTDKMQQARDFLAAYVKAYVEQGHKISPLPFIYDANSGGYERAYKQNHLDIDWKKTVMTGTKQTTEESYTNKLVFVCSSFCATMIHQAWGIDFIGETGIKDTNIRGTGFANPNRRGRDVFNKVDGNDFLEVGDIITGAGYRWHAMLYLGCNENGKHIIAQTGEDVITISELSGDYPDNTAITVSQLRARSGRTSDGTIKYGEVSRIKPELMENWVKPSQIIIRWPGGARWPRGETTTFDGDTLLPTELYRPDLENGVLSYKGIADSIGNLGITERKSIFAQIIEFFAQVINWIIGLVTMTARIPLVGIGAAVEYVISLGLQIFSINGESVILTLEDIVYNRVPILDVNILNAVTAGGQALADGSLGNNVITALRESIIMWYYAFRNLVIVSLLLALLYLGIRMAISTIAEDKAKYKRLLVDWFISFVIVLFIHFFIVLILNLNDYFVGIFAAKAGSESTSFYLEMKSLAHNIKFTYGWYGTIMYLALIWYTIKFAWKYIKRLLNVFILIIISPLVAISYAIDKIKDSKAQSLGKWMRELSFSVLMQSAHALTYTVFMVDIAGKITQNDDMLQAIGSCVFLVITIKFMDTIEDIFENVFQFKSASVVSDINEKFSKQLLKVGMIKAVSETTYGFWGGIAKRLIPPSVRMNYRKGKLEETYGKMDESLLTDEDKKALRKAKTYEKFEELYKNTQSSKTIELMEQEKKARENRLKAQTEGRKKITGSMKQVGKAMFTGIPMLFENPAAGITMLIAGGGAIKDLYSLSKRDQLHPGSISGKSFSGLKADTERMETLKGVREAELELTGAIREKFAEPDDVITKGSNEKATKKEIEIAQKVQKALNTKLAEAAKIVPKATVSTAIKDSVLTGAKNVDINSIIQNIEKADPKIKVNMPNFEKNFTTEMRKAVLEKATGKSGAINVVFSQKIQEKINKTTTALTSKSDKIENFEKELEKEIEADISSIEFQQELVNSLDIADLSCVITRTINREGSIERNYTTAEGNENTSEKSDKEVVEQLKKYDNIVDKTIQLRETYAEATAKLNLPVPDLVQEMQQKIKNKGKRVEE